MLFRYLLDFIKFPMQMWDTGGGSAPGPSAEERALTKEQTDLLRRQRELMERQLATQDLLNPLLMSELGIEQTFGDVANPRYTEVNNQIAQLTQQLAAIPEGTRQGVYGSSPQNMAQNVQRAKLTKQLEALQSEKANLQSTNRQVTGFQKRPKTPEELQQEQINKRFQDLTLAELETQAQGAPQRAEIENLTRERTLKALKGELPVDPTLMRELETQEMTLRESLRAQLGPGYETSTPGIEALANFERRRGELIYGANRGEITLGEQLSGAREASGYSRATGFMPQAELGDRLRTSQLSQIFGYGVPGRGIDFGSVATQFQGPLNQLFQERQRQADRSAQGRSDWFNLIGTGVGIGAGMLL